MSNLNVPPDRDLNIGKVVEEELDKLLVLLLAEELDERLRLEGLSELDGSESILGKAVVEVLGDCW